MNKTVVILNGHPRSGKTTVSGMLQQKYGATIRSSIDMVKSMVEDYFQWSGSKEEDSRRLLSNLKMCLAHETELIEDDLDRHYEDFLAGDNEFYIIDIREPEEIKKYQERYDAVTVFVDNLRVTPVSSNSSDARVLDLEYDYTIKNCDTLENLQAEIDMFAQWSRL